MVVLAVAMAVLGPQGIPKVARELGRARAEIRRLTADVPPDTLNALTNPRAVLLDAVSGPREMVAEAVSAPRLALADFKSAGAPPLRASTTAATTAAGLDSSVDVSDDPAFD
jgi:mttA/Hcf106 family